MESCNDYSITFAKGLVLKTPAGETGEAQRRQDALDAGGAKTNDLLKRLQEAEQQQDFFSGLYRQYTTNLLKLVIYVRSLVSNARVREYLEAHHPAELKAVRRDHRQHGAVGWCASGAGSGLSRPFVRGTNGRSR